MAYNVTDLYNQTGLIGAVDSLNVASNFIFIDSLLIVIFVVIFAIGINRQVETKKNALMASAITFVISALIWFSTGAGVVNSSQPYFTRVLVLFVVTILLTIWNTVSEAS